MRLWLFTEKKKKNKKHLTRLRCITVFQGKQWKNEWNKAFTNLVTSLISWRYHQNLCNRDESLDNLAQDSLFVCSPVYHLFIANIRLIWNRLFLFIYLFIYLSRSGSISQQFSIPSDNLLASCGVIVQEGMCAFCINVQRSFL